jgi:hypothetical protein
MRILVLVSLLLAAFAFADDTQLGAIEAQFGVPAVAGDDVICSQPFDYATLINGVGFSSGNSWMIADDFTFGSDANIDLIEIWAIYASGNATGYTIQLRADGTGPGAIYTSGVSSAVTHTNTGLSQWGYALWYSAISADLDFVGGPTYWLAMQTTGGAGAHYWLATPNVNGDETYFSADNGATWSSSTTNWGAPYDQFMIISGLETSLARDTWASIKTLF